MRLRPPQTVENKRVTIKKKTLGGEGLLWYSVFAFVALVSPLDS